MRAIEQEGGPSSKMGFWWDKIVATTGSGNVFVDALSYDYAYQPGYTITYALEARDGDNGSYGGIRWRNDGARDAFANATEAWSAVADIHFDIYDFSFQSGDTPEPSLIDWVERLEAMGTDSETLGRHELPSSGYSLGEFNTQHPLFTQENNAVGGFSYVTFLHEIGHGLGLLHPHDPASAFPGVSGPYDAGDFSLNQGLYTVMSYVEGVGVPLSPSYAYGWWGTPMAFDIAAVQHIYGPNPFTAAGDNIYLLPKVNAAGTFWSCIWDVNGIDTISAAGASAACVIDLRAATLLNEVGGGGWASSIGGIYGGFTIANGVVIENATGGSGADTIRGNGVANLLIGNAGNDTISGGDGTDQINGGDGADTLSGDAGNDQLDGGAGSDTMRGALGNDSYVVDNAGDQVIETSATGGTDTVRSAISFTLGAYLEKLVLTGTGATGGTGNSLANTLTGNAAGNTLDGGSGNDWLDGAGGADTMTGAAGNDTYVVDNAGDKALETSATGGIDTVRSLVGFTLGANVEHLVLTGGAAVNGTGNGIANSLTGNAGANLLDGAAGADTMTGGAGNDIYVVDNAGDKVIEMSAAGTDTVRSALAHSLAGHVEKLVLTGLAAVAGTGNSLANTITGNGAANSLDGRGGNDLIDGGAGDDRINGSTGSDQLKGGAGRDTFLFDTAPGAANIDAILDFYAPSDTISLNRSVFAQAGANGTLKAAAFHVGTAAHDSSDRIVYDQASGKIFYDADGNGAGAALLFATVNAGTTLSYADFLIYG